MAAACTGACAIFSVFSTLFNIFGHRDVAPPGVPGFVLDYAPLVYLYSEDVYRPSDIGAQLKNTKPEVNYTVVSGAPSPLTLNNLASLNALGGEKVYLTSIDNIATNPSWLLGVKPDSTGKTNDAVSCAIIVHDRGSGSVDAFYMYFYAYNQGSLVAGEQFGDHVGDWEHNMIRFQDGKPQAIWYSEHSAGTAYTFEAVSKSKPPSYLTGDAAKVPYYGPMRPIGYSANGTHANYAVPGTHDITPPGLGLPKNFVADYTNKGVLWDPTLSAYYYTVSFPSAVNSGAPSTSNPTPTFSAYPPASPTPKPPTSWLSFIGQWGDKQYRNSDPRQTSALGFYKYVGGPTGPEDKGLDRETVCLGVTGDCVIHNSLSAKTGN